MKSIKYSFTLIELLIVVAIISILISLLQPSLARFSERSRQLVCAHRLDQLHTAHYIYADDHNGAQVTPTEYLTADGFNNWPNVSSIPERSLLILEGYLSKSIEVFICPSDTQEREDGPSLYIRSASFSYTRNGYIQYKNTREISPHTVLLAEEHNFAPMNDGTFYANQWDMLSTRHDGWGHVSFMDGSIEQLDTTGYNEQPAQWRLKNYLLLD